MITDFVNPREHSLPPLERHIGERCTKKSLQLLERFCIKPGGRALTSGGLKCISPHVFFTLSLNSQRAVAYGLKFVRVGCV
jgi:hypothetical protein